ncbi:uncharacterized protein LOC121051604 [Rosa chinensis]|uniref:uncharacterized protein LOC121051604 n=1 Tax=Rosa chinensis TaxID=74649 RepID=UPI001AD919D1|nr:uncharacterized protein LOC121051604 [Rosa chinensis]
MGIMNLPAIRRCSSVHNIVVKFTKKRYRKKLDMLTNEEDEQEEEYLQARQVKRRIFPEVEAELARLMMKLNLPCGRVQREREQDTAAIQKYTTKRKLTNLHEDEEEEEEITWVKRRKTLEHIGKEIKALRITTRQEYGTSCNIDFASLPPDIVLLILDKLLEPIDHARFAVVCKEWQSLAKQYNCETQPWVKVLPPMLWIPTQSHGSDDPMAMLYSLSERKIYRNMKLPVPRDDRIYCGYGWMAKYRYLNKSSDYYASLAITLMNPFRNAKDIIRLPPIRDSIFSVKQVVKITLPADPTLDRNNYMWF